MSIQMGKLEAKDQVETAIYMGTLPYVDKDNIGDSGLELRWLHTLMSIAKGAKYSKPVWLLHHRRTGIYDSIYRTLYAIASRKSGRLW